MLHYTDWGGLGLLSPLRWMVQGHLLLLNEKDSEGSSGFNGKQ